MTGATDSELDLDYYDYLQSTNLIFLIQGEYFLAHKESTPNDNINGVIYTSNIPATYFPENNYKPFFEYVINKLFESKISLKQNNICIYNVPALKSVINKDSISLIRISEQDIASFNNKYFLISLDELDNFDPTMVEFYSHNTIKLVKQGKYINKSLFQSKIPRAFNLI